MDLDDLDLGLRDGLSDDDLVLDGDDFLGHHDLRRLCVPTEAVASDDEGDDDSDFGEFTGRGGH